MMQVVQQTKKEKIAMYMKCSKKELAEMLWACNVIIDQMPPKVSYRIDCSYPKTFPE